MVFVLKKPDEYSWIRYIKSRIAKNKNFMCICQGPTGSGKSWTLLSVAEMLDPEFSADRVVFTGRELMTLVNSGALKKGSVILFDEAQIDLSSRSWQSLTNKMLNYLISTFRHRNFILFFSSPYSDFLDAQTRRLFHAVWETITIDYTKNTCLIKPLTLSYNPAVGKWYNKYLQVVKPGAKGTSIIETWSIPKPSAELIKAYEAKKTEFTTRLNQEIEAKLRELEPESAKKELTEQQFSIVECLDKGMILTETAKELNVSNNLITLQMKLIKKKGYDFKPQRNKGVVVKYDVIKPFK